MRFLAAGSAGSAVCPSRIATWAMRPTTVVLLSWMGLRRSRADWELDLFSEWTGRVTLAPRIQVRARTAVELALLRIERKWVSGWRRSRKLSGRRG